MGVQEESVDTLEAPCHTARPQRRKTLVVCRTCHMNIHAWRSMPQSQM